MALRLGVSELTSPLGRSELPFSQFRVGQNIIPKAFGTVFGPKAKMIPIIIGTAKYLYVPIAIGTASRIVGFKNFFIYLELVLIIARNRLQNFLVFRKG